MSDSLKNKILEHLGTGAYRPTKARRLARDLNLQQEGEYNAFRDALRDLMHAGRVVLGGGGNVTLPGATASPDGIVGTYRQNKRGFGFVVPTDPSGHEDLFIPENENAGAITGDVVRARIVNRHERDGKAMYRGKVVEIISRSQKRFVGTLAKLHGNWIVQPDGNIFTQTILAPDAAARHIKPGTKVVVELTVYPQDGEPAQGVITEVLGQAGEKDVDLKSVIVQFNLPGEFPPECLDQARAAVDQFNTERQWPQRIDLSDKIICTIDPNDAKDYDDAISLERLSGGQWELGVHIADVSHFIPPGSPLDEEARTRGNSCYFPGHVIPMLPEILSNGVCSLQEAVPRLCKSAFITLDEDARTIRARFANTVIRSANRLRYTEAQAIIDNADQIPHPDGPRKIDAYKPEVVKLLHDMNHLAKLIQKRRLAAGQIVLDLPEINLKLDENGRVIGAEPEDQSFTHTLIEMFMVEANEAAARALDSQHLHFLRRTHPDPETETSEKLRHFVEVAGYKLPKKLDRHALQQLLASVRGKPESFTINLAVLKSLTRAEYSPRVIGHYALASEHYCHFTSPIRRYADLTIHRMLGDYIAQNPRGGRHGKPAEMESPSESAQAELGKQLSFTERRADDAEKELRQIKILDLLSKQIGEEFAGVVTGITNFGIFIQLTDWLIDGLIRYEDLMDDWWDVDERTGSIRGQRTGKRIGIGDSAKVRIVRVDPARRELDLSVVELQGKDRSPMSLAPAPAKKVGKSRRVEQKKSRGGQSMRNRKPQGGKRKK